MSHKLLEQPSTCEFHVKIIENKSEQKLLLNYNMIDINALHQIKLI